MRGVQPALRLVAVLLVVSAMNSSAQQSSETTTPQANSQSSSAALVPRLVRFSGSVKDTEGNPLTGVITATFSLYSQQGGGTALWQETQNVTADSSGHYFALLGSTQPQGLPVELFTSGEARWLGVRPQGMTEQARVLLVSAPYALKAADAETLGGLPPSAFVLAAPTSGLPTDSAASAGASASALPPAGTVTGSGTMDFVPLWTSSSNLGNSALFQSGSGSTAKVGVNTTTPAATLDVRGGTNIEGLLDLPATGAATSSAGKNSQAQDFVASSFDSSTSKAVNQTFQWRAEPAGNNTSIPSATLNLLFGSGTSNPTETGVKISGKGLFTFAAGQKFPGTGTITGITTASGSGLTGGGTSGSLTLSLLKTCSTNQTLQWSGTSWACASAGMGTVTGVTAGTDLTGGGSSGNVTLNLDTTKVPLLKAANTFVGNQAVTGNLSDTGNISATGSISGQTGSFVGNTGAFTNILSATQTGSGMAISGFASATSGVTFGVSGSTSSPSGVGVAGEGGTGVEGIGFASGATIGVNGVSGSKLGAGVLGQAPGSAFSGIGASLRGQLNTGLWGDTTGPFATGIGVLGTADNNFGVLARNSSPTLTPLLTENFSASPGAVAFWADLPNLLAGTAIIGDADCGNAFMGLQLGQIGMTGCNNYTLLGDSSGNTYLNAGAGGSNPVFISFRINNATGMTLNNDTSVSIGSLDVTSSLTKPAGSFKIDHPLDPANKYLYHSFVESPDMKNIYDGVAVLDDNGEAVVTLPDWFEALNRDFRYQLTTIGGFAPVFVREEIQNNHFKISGGRAGIKVSWQVTGTRQDAFAKAHRIQVEVEKAPKDRGHYLHPELFGAPETDRIGFVAPMSRDVKPKRNHDDLLRHPNFLPGISQGTPARGAAASAVTTPVLSPLVKPASPLPTSVK